MSHRWKTLLAFGTIYFVWGSTFLAIRVGVLAMPPLLFAADGFCSARQLIGAPDSISGAFEVINEVNIHPVYHE